MTVPITFWSDTTTPWTWGSPLEPYEFSSTDQSYIQGLVDDLYDNSTTFFYYAYDYTVTNSTPLNIGRLSLSEPAYTALWGLANDTYTLINPLHLEDTYYFNDKGVLVQDIDELAVAHELIHQMEQIYDPNIDASDLDKNASDFDFKGEVVRTQNEIAGELGYNDNIQISYIDAHSLSWFTSNGISAAGSYTDDRHIDVSRMGSSSGDTIDHSLRTSLSTGGELNDLIFGFGGNDIITAALGDDFVYGGAGSDKIYGGDGSDKLVGDADNDYIDSGLNLVDLMDTGTGDYLYGGAGNDILIMRGLYTEANGGADDDQFWIVSAPTEGYGYAITDSDPGDSLYWNGYLLEGGPKTIIDGEELYGFDIGALDDNGFRYYQNDGTDYLSIFAPDGNYLVIFDFENGDLGIDVGDPVTHSEAIFFDDPGDSPDLGPQITPFVPIAISNIAHDSLWGNYEDLPGFSTTLSTWGPETLPTMYII